MKRNSREKIDKYISSDPVAVRAWKTLQWANPDKKRARMPVNMR